MDDNKSLFDHIASDENLRETVNNNEMVIESIHVSQPYTLPTISNINDSIAKNEDSKDDDMIIEEIVEDNELNENTNNNKVENNELVEDNFTETLKDYINENDMIVDRKVDNINDVISISKPPREKVDIYEIDGNTNIVHMNNLIHGRFPTYF